jgi:hypothetical protein
MKNLFLLFAVVLLAGTQINVLEAQIRTPAASPLSEVKQTVGLTEVSIIYSRPSMKGRKIFGDDGIVPYGKIWRTAANAVTKVTFSDDVTIANTKLPKGSYAILSTPGMDSWTVMFYTYETASWGAYSEKTPDVSYMAKPVKTGKAVETFTIDINNLRNTSAHLEISWENTSVSVPFEVEVDSRVMADINKIMSGPTAGELTAAAAYYHDSGKDLNQALAWIEKANGMGQPRYWNVRRQAMILGDLMRYDDAIKAANQSIALAKEAGDDDYVRMNEKSIAEWTSMKAKKK